MGIEAALEESIAVRAQARMEANAAFRIQSHQALPGDETTAGEKQQCSDITNTAVVAATVLWQ